MIDKLKKNKADFEKFYNKLKRAEEKKMNYDSLIKYFVKDPGFNLTLSFFVHSDWILIRLLCKKVKVEITEYMTKFLNHAKVVFYQYGNKLKIKS